MITLVSAFFDIGRSNWVGPNLPNYLKRTTDEYFERFERLLKLDNKIIVYTSPDLEYRFADYQKQKPNLSVVIVSNFRMFSDVYENIIRVQNLPEFKSTLLQPYNPEYWNADYVMVNLLKSWFVVEAFDQSLIDYGDIVAWVDFGYARKDEDVPTTKWNYNFDPDKIHVFSHRKTIPEMIDVRNIIDHNEVYLMGCHIVAETELWCKLHKLMFDNMNVLLNNNLVDDDQTLLLMSYIQNKKLFEVHHIPTDYWFCLFTTYNKGN